MCKHADVQATVWGLILVALFVNIVVLYGIDMSTRKARHAASERASKMEQRTAAEEAAAAIAAAAGTEGAYCISGNKFKAALEEQEHQEADKAEKKMQQKKTMVCMGCTSPTVKNICAE